MATQFPKGMLLGPFTIRKTSNVVPIGYDFKIVELIAKLCAIEYVTKFSKCDKYVYIQFSSDAPHMGEIECSHTFCYFFIFCLASRADAQVKRDDEQQRK
jgi:hypothetical protein